MDPSKGRHVARHEPRVQSIKRGKISFGRNIFQKSDFETVERERERERERGGNSCFLRRFLGFRRSKVIEPRVKVLRLDEGHA